MPSTSGKTLSLLDCTFVGTANESRFDLTIEVDSFGSSDEIFPPLAEGVTIITIAPSEAEISVSPSSYSFDL